MGELYQRWASLKVGKVLVVSSMSTASLRFTFAVKKTIKPEPNRADVSVYGLNEQHRSQFEQLEKVPVQIDAGYGPSGEDASTIFVGFLRTALTISDGPDKILQLASGDAELAARKSRVSISVAKGTPTDQAFRQLAEAVGVDVGNLPDAVRLIKSRFGAGGLFPAGGVIYGNAARELTSISRSLGLEWSIQDGRLQFLDKAASLAGKAIVLGGPTGAGMIGSPAVDGKGILSASMLLQRDVSPGRILVVQAERLKGQYRIEETEHVGDTRGGEWQVNVKAKRY